MSYKSKLTASDGHEFTVTRADADNAIGSIIILHAVYGVTDHIADLCDRFAAEGISAAAPWLFDRTGPDVVHSYAHEGTDAGRQSYAAITEEQILMDIEACAGELRQSGPVALCGFCTGGTWAWVGADALDLDAAIIYYGSQVADHLHRKPKCPAEMHYGDIDFVVPMEVLSTIREQNPDVPCHVYPGCNHAFFNPDQKFYDEDAAAVVWERSLSFLRERFS